jgi:hypothetical protein
MKKNKSGLTAEQKRAAAKINLPADWKPSADVIVYDTESEAGQAIERLRAGDLGALFDLVPLINKGSDRNRIERKTLGKANQSSKQTANERKKAALSNAAHLMEERRELRFSRRKSQLAKAVWERLPTIERPTERTIRRWITEWLKPQK